MYKIIISSLFFCFVISCKSTDELKYKKGLIEIQTSPSLDNSVYNRASKIKVQFFSADNKNLKLGLMMVEINWIHFITDIDGGYERTLGFGKKYNFKFYCSGFYAQRKTIKIEKGYEYLIKIFMERKQEKLY